MNALEAPSPYIDPDNPYVQYAWDSTSLSWLKTCPRKYQYSQIEGWHAKGTSIHLRFGLIYGEALEQYEWLIADGQDREEAICHVVKWAMVASHPWNYDDTNKSRENLIRAIVWYFAEYENDNATTYILANGRPAVELTFKFDTEWAVPGTAEPYVLSGHIDRLVTFAGDLMAADKKTTKSSLGSYYFRQYDLNTQMSLYSVASQVVFQTPVRGVMIDAMQSAVGFSRFMRGVTFRTPSQLDEFMKNTKHWLGMAYGYAHQRFWPMNESSCFLCPFNIICSQAPEVRDLFLETHFERRPWNPLEVRNATR